VNQLAQLVDEGDLRAPQDHVLLLCELSGQLVGSTQQVGGWDDLRDDAEIKCPIGAELLPRQQEVPPAIRPRRSGQTRCTP
jgi:hypothetical protein